MVLLLAGCSMAGPGRLYTNVILPYSTDFNNTTVGTKHCILKAHKIKEPVSGYGVTVEWSTSQIQSAARDAGITTISCIDEETFSILLGIYTQEKLIIYGD